MALNAVIDLSHYQDVTSWSEVAGDGIVAIINKCTQGTGFVDPTYAERQSAAKAAGLLWGAYHFGEGGDGVQQAQYFLQNATPAANDLLVLDFEQNTQGASMTLAEAEQFVSYLQQQRGRWPVLYGGSYLIQELGGSANSTLSNCPLWIAAYDYAGTPYRFIVNGVTGKASGKAPWSWVKITLAVLAVVAIVLAIMLVKGK